MFFEKAKFNYLALPPGKILLNLSIILCLQTLLPYLISVLNIFIIINIKIKLRNKKCNKCFKINYKYQLHQLSVYIVSVVSLLKLPQSSDMYISWEQTISSRWKYRPRYFSTLSTFNKNIIKRKVQNLIRKQLLIEGISSDIETKTHHSIISIFLDLYTNSKEEKFT